eukprot:GHRQ01039847.1.p1 GENE.GHRQ01039847.1~~GHRQ01039847.1.p1  ORF type:complete len:106 (+),score=18.68 GHRQ01039847.1:516-833(+)
MQVLVHPARLLRLDPRPERQHHARAVRVGHQHRLDALLLQLQLDFVLEPGEEAVASLHHRDRQPPVIRHGNLHKIEWRCVQLLSVFCGLAEGMQQGSMSTAGCSD